MKKNSQHVFATNRQQPVEGLEQYRQKLKILSRDSNFQTTTADQAWDEFIKDAFISGLDSKYIRQRLLENNQLDLATAREMSLTLEMAEKQSSSYIHTDGGAVLNIHNQTISLVQATQAERNIQSSTPDLFVSDPSLPAQNTLQKIQNSLLELRPKENIIFVVSSNTPGGIAQPIKLNAIISGKRNNFLRFVDQRFLPLD